MRLQTSPHRILVALLVGSAVASTGGCGPGEERTGSGLTASSTASGAASDSASTTDATSGTTSSTSTDGTTAESASTTAGASSDATVTGTTANTSESTTATETATATATGDPPDPGSTIPVGEGDHFLLGANYPWKSYGGDFGGNNWGVYGVHTKEGEIGADLETLGQNSMRVVRWFVFTDGRAGINFDGDGTPTGLGENVLDDMTAAVALAEAKGVYLVPVLIDFHWMFYAQYNNGVQTGGRADVIMDPAKRAAFVDNVVTPLVQHSAGSPSVLAWEIINEPEWSIADLPSPSVDGQAQAVPLADFYAFAAAISSAVHQHSSAYVTLGSACLKWHRVWTPAFAAEHGWPSLELDFYQAHYYPWMDNQSVEDDPELGTVQFSPTVQSYAELGLDRPMVVGEFIVSDKAGERLDNIVERGYAGAWPWSLTSDFSLDLEGISAWADVHPELVVPAP